MDCVEYQGGYKYQLKRNYMVQTSLKTTRNIDIDFITLYTDGVLLIKNGYAWDGPSGPTFDTLNFMRGSLVHDALYQLMREGQLDHKYYRPLADEMLYAICVEDGMWRIRAWWVLKGVTWFGDPCADPRHKRPSMWAPKEPNE